MQKRAGETVGMAVKVDVILPQRHKDRAIFNVDNSTTALLFKIILNKQNRFFNETNISGVRKML